MNITIPDKMDGTVGKAVEVLDRVATFGRPVRFTELLDRSPFPKATLYRLLQTLTSQGMLAYDDSRQTYAPGLRLVQLAHHAWAQSSIAPLARPHIDQLSRETGETIHLAQLDRGQVLYVDKRNARQAIEMFAQAGKVGPAYCTGVGKVMLAYLDPPALEEAMKAQTFYPHTPGTLTSEQALRAELAAIRARGYGYDREEHEPGIICCAAPILSRTGHPLGALSLTTSTARSSLQNLDLLAPQLMTTAASIATDVESWRFPERNEGRRQE